MEAYRLSYQVRQLLDSIGEGGELTPETEAILDELSKNQETFLEAIGLAIREHNLSSTALRGEIAWLTQGARRHEEAGSNLREYLLQAMKSFGLKNVVTTVQKIDICDSPAKVEVAPDFNILAADDKFVVINRSLDKDAIKEAAKKNEPLPAGVSVVRGEHVRISPR